MWIKYLPLASGDNCETFDACLLFALNSGSRNATGKHEANEFRQSPTNGRWRFNSSIIHSLENKIIYLV